MRKLSKGQLFGEYSFSLEPSDKVQLNSKALENEASRLRIQNPDSISGPLAQKAYSKPWEDDIIFSLKNKETFLKDRIKRFKTELELKKDAVKNIKSMGWNS
ncbi:MAG: hypothetical protein H7844_11245 [Nitrospirae bacterium YQR-1]